MKNITAFLPIIIVGLLLAGCWKKNLPGKVLDRFQDDPHGGQAYEIPADSTPIAVRPGSVLLTGHSQFRLVPLYKINYDADSTAFTGSNHFHQSYVESENSSDNQWHGNFMPGIEAVYGQNMVNVLHYDTKSKTSRNFFPKSVLVKTLYYPAFSSDTLNRQPIKRNYFLVSAYDQDTNHDGFINANDLRHFYYFDLQGKNQRWLVPANFSVVRSEFDSGNDFIYVYARLDENANGAIEDNEAIHVFLVDLKAAEVGERVY